MVPCLTSKGISILKSLRLNVFYVSDSSVTSHTLELLQERMLYSFNRSAINHAKILMAKRN